MKTKAKAKKFMGIILALVCVGAVLIFSGCSGKTTGKIVIELYPEYAPATVDNFIKLVNEGFYDGLIFHRVYPGFMAQGGGQNADGVPKQADSISGEFSSNGFTQNTLKHTKGVISMARADDPNSASSEFFIMYGDNTGLDGLYAAFGKVIEGMDAIDKLQDVELESGFAIDPEPTTPVNPIVITKATVLENTDGGNPKVQMEIEY